MVPLAQRLVRLDQLPVSAPAPALAVAEPAPSPAEGGEAEVSAALNDALAVGETHALEARSLAHSAWGSQEGEKLFAALARGLGDLEERIGAALVKSVMPFIEAGVRTQASGAFRETLNSLLASAETLTIEVRGPADLLAPLAALNDPRLVLVESATGELEARCGDAHIETRMQAALAGFWPKP